MARSQAAALRRGASTWQYETPLMTESTTAAAHRVRAEHLGAGREARPLAGRRLVLRDGVHLFSPRAPHHRVLAKEGAASHSPGAFYRLKVLGLRTCCFTHAQHTGTLPRI